MDKKQKPVIYTVATAHLDTIWNWDFEQTVREYIPATLDKKLPAVSEISGICFQL